jgi:fructose-1,6-bisphosphatase/inositol monophosphatase family enzyme
MELPGNLNGHAAGIIMKEMVRRAIFAIRRHFDSFEVIEKVGMDNRKDLLTSADRAAQEIYAKSIRQCFPGYGIIAEEDKLSVPCEIPGENLFFTVDPLDGTKAFIRRQSHAIGTMISLVRNGEVIGAYIGDVMTHEIYGFRPGSQRVHRITDYNAAVQLQPSPRPLRESYVSLRSEPDYFSPCVQQVARGTRFGGMFQSMEVSGGSIGVDVARLWKGEVGAIVLEPFFNTPWDYCPVFGISQQLGFVEVAVVDDKLELIKTQFNREGTRRVYEAFLIHEKQLDELRSAFDSELAC